ncbi:MAG: UTP--glucose-1-phosphate uridylyltransferase [Pirellulales bacterium]|nr:UTP--glucose-1-phosphate uridylyltransferase [Pirellulales bacterium]
MNIDLVDITQILQETSQNRLLTHWQMLAGPQQESLARQLAAVDLRQLVAAWKNRAASQDWRALAAASQPPAAFRLPPAQNPWNTTQARQAGRSALSAGQVGVLLVAGGQGTRLGSDLPKGMFPIGPVTGASLYQWLLMGVLAARRRAGRSIPLWIMTSPATHAPTADFLAKEQNFGLPRGDVQLFSQGTLPALDLATGELLLAGPDRLALSPDGHGGLLNAFANSGGLAEAEDRGLKYLFYMQVDNPLVSVADPTFLGYHILSGSEMSTQVIAKRGPLEKVGNVVTCEGRTRIIEYSDLPPDLAERTTATGEPVFWAGSIAVHVLDVAFLRRMTEIPDALPLHVAQKKVSYWDPSRGEVAPDAPNACKFERFIFDLLPQAREAIVMEVDRAEHFAPVKNSNNEEFDTPRTVQAQMRSNFCRWLAECGVTVPEETVVEISPLVATNAEELATWLQAHPLENSAVTSSPLLLKE